MPKYKASINKTKIYDANDLNHDFFKVRNFKPYFNLFYKIHKQKNKRINPDDIIADFESFLKIFPNIKNIPTNSDLMEKGCIQYALDTFTSWEELENTYEALNYRNASVTHNPPAPSPNCIRSGKEKESEKLINPTPIASVGCSAVENFIPAVFKENVGVAYQVYMLIRRNWWNNLEILPEAEQVKAIQEMMLDNKIVSAIKSKFAYKIVDAIDRHKKLASARKFINRSTYGKFITENQTKTNVYKLIKNIAHSHDAPRSRLKYSIKVVNACKSLISALGLLKADECFELLKLRKNKSQCRFVACINKLHEKYIIH
jgi:hypothetical protein